MAFQQVGKGVPLASATNAMCWISRDRTYDGVSMGLTVSRQTAKNLTVNRQKRAIFTVNRQKGTYKLAVKRLQGPSNLAISAAHLGCWLPKNRFNR